MALPLRCVSCDAESFRKNQTTREYKTKIYCDECNDLRTCFYPRCKNLSRMNYLITKDNKTEIENCCRAHKLDFELVIEKYSNDEEFFYIGELHTKSALNRFEVSKFYPLNIKYINIPSGMENSIICLKYDNMGQKIPRESNDKYIVIIPTHLEHYVENAVRFISNNRFALLNNRICNVEKICNLINLLYTECDYYGDEFKYVNVGYLFEIWEKYYDFNPCKIVYENNFCSMKVISSSYH